MDLVRACDAAVTAGCAVWRVYRPQLLVEALAGKA